MVPIFFSLLLQPRAFLSLRPYAGVCCDSWARCLRARGSIPPYGARHVPELSRLFCLGKFARLTAFSSFQLASKFQTGYNTELTFFSITHCDDRYLLKELYYLLNFDLFYSTLLPSLQNRN
jgi:hypothetical protein